MTPRRKKHDRRVLGHAGEHAILSVPEAARELSRGYDRVLEVNGVRYKIRRRGPVLVLEGPGIERKWLGVRGVPAYEAEWWAAQHLSRVLG